MNREILAVFLFELIYFLREFDENTVFGFFKQFFPVMKLFGAVKLFTRTKLLEINFVLGSRGMFFKNITEKVKILK